MLSLSPTLYFNRKDSGNFASSHSDTPWRTTSHSPHSSLLSNTPSPFQQLLADVKETLVSNGPTQVSEPSPEVWDLDCVLDVLPSTPRCDTPSCEDSDTRTQSSSSLSSQLSWHDCQCNSLSKCPKMLRRHYAHLQRHKTYHSPIPFVLSTYFLAADEYTQARQTLSLPTAKLKRAAAEYDWIKRQRNSTRLLSPRLHKELTVARDKMIIAKEEWETASIEVMDKAQSLMDMGRF